MICPQCGERDSVASDLSGSITAMVCGACGNRWEVFPTKPTDELPGIKAALARGDMDYVTDERAEWLVAQVEAGRRFVEFWRQARNVFLKIGSVPAYWLTQGDDHAGRVMPKS